MNSQRILIKLGGAALQSKRTLGVVTELIKQLHSIGHQVILVHGGGPAINEALVNQGLQWTFVDGQRVTTPEMMSIIEKTLCETVNGRVVDHLNLCGLPAQGFSGAQRQTLLCQKASEVLGQVGQITAVHTDAVQEILSKGYVPVIAPIGVDTLGVRYNINADWSATHLAAALKVDELFFLTDMNGILDSQAQRIPQMSATNLESLMTKQIVTGGMLTKTKAVLHALKSGVKTVRILRGDDADQLLQSRDVGTVCHLNETLKEVHDATI